METNSVDFKNLPFNLLLTKARNDIINSKTIKIAADNNSIDIYKKYDIDFVNGQMHAMQPFVFMEKTINTLKEETKEKIKSNFQMKENGWRYCMNNESWLEVLSV